ncbi:MAG: UbiA family prenyltransferase [Bacteroidales bacterium]|nr:UbiA family prenyltransferase [Bacteroidales bacterium]MDD4216600.1 UbiA family prenyltransferase [Bacteroidales bacterium]MDY0141505.1 UbiA family prenyltransferase [Bacteroidales bacterium]
MISLLKKYWQAFRLNEVILMSGFFIIGGFFAITEFNKEVAYKLIGLIILSITIVLSVYSFNAAAGKSQDANNLRLKNLWNLSKSTFLIFAALFFAFSIIISIYLNIISSILTVIIIFLWILYSHPVIGLKQKAIYGTLIHFIGQILHFLMAWLIFQNFNWDAVLIAIYFSIAFSSGHLLHEIIDYDADKNSGFRTSPVVFGIKRTSIVLLIILIINVFLISYLYAIETISLIAWICFFSASFLHLLLLLLNIRNVKTKALLIRNIYRCLYFASGIIYLALKLL